MLPKWETLLKDLWKKSRFTSYFYQTVHFAADFHIPTLALTVSASGLSLIYNPEFVDQYSKEELTGLLVHEMMHILLNHHHRIFQGKDVGLQNLAQDMVINSYLIEHKKSFFSRTGRDIREEPHVILPNGLPVIPRSYFADKNSIHINEDPSWENIYNWLQEKSQTQNNTENMNTLNGFESEQPHPKATPFNKHKKSSKTIMEHFDNCDGLMFDDGNNTPIPTGIHLFHDAYLDEKKTSIKKQVISFASRDENSKAERIYQHVSSLINEAKPAKIKSFSTLIKQFIHQATSSAEWDYSASRFNRRYLGEGIYAPGRYYQKKKSITIAVDVSGSMVMKPGEIETAFGVIETLLKAYRVHLICIDEHVFVPSKKEKGFIPSKSTEKKYIYRKGDWKYIQTGSSGATFFAPLFDTFIKESREPLIVISDGDIYDLDRLKPYKHTIWAVSANRSSPFKPPFGKVAVITSENIK